MYPEAIVEPVVAVDDIANGHINFSGPPAKPDLFLKVEVHFVFDESRERAALDRTDEGAKCRREK